jgi:hypothetical protein
MPLHVVVGRVSGGLIVPEPPLPLPEGLRVTIVAEVPETSPLELEEKGLVAVDPEDADLIRALTDAEGAAPTTPRCT